MRCPVCFGRVDSAHDILGRCPKVPPATPPKVNTSRRGYLPPSRASRMPRDEYLASIAVTRDQKLAAQRERQRRYRLRRSAK